MAFPGAMTNVWSGADPDDSDVFGYGAQEMRKIRTDVYERLQLLPLGIGEKGIVSDVAGAYAIDLSLASSFTLTMTADTTFTFINPPPVGWLGSFLLILAEDGTGGWTPTFPASVKWQYNVTPTMDETLSTVTTYSFFTTNAGTRYYGNMLGTAFPV